MHDTNDPNSASVHAAIAMLHDLLDQIGQLTKAQLLQNGKIKAGIYTTGTLFSLQN